MKILLIEDDRSCGNDIQEMIQEEGHQCVWIRGVSEVCESKLGLSAFDGRWMIDAKGFDAAFVDGLLPGSLDGHQIVPHLTQLGVICIGISSSTTLNELMLSAGASFACAKCDVGSRLSALLTRVRGVQGTS
jgi:DNA-binding response OmpR family regulator